MSPAPCCAGPREVRRKEGTMINKEAVSMEPEPKLGQFVQDKVTGFAGVVTARVEYLDGVTQCLVQPRVKADGEFVEAQWVYIVCLRVTDI
jgi:hypothetical protein